MFPTGNEFLTLYFVYLMVLILIAFDLYIKKNKIYVTHLVIYSLYVGFMLYVFSDKENFNGGNSLVILFYGFVFPILHVFIYGIIKIIIEVGNARKKRCNNK